MTREVSLKYDSTGILHKLADPFVVTSILGHVRLIMEKEDDEFKSFDRVTSSSDVFRVIFEFGNPFSKLLTSSGELQRKVTPSSISYKMNPEDNVFSISTNFVIEKGKLRIINSVKYLSPQAVNYIGMKEDELELHLIEGHLIPYFKFFSGNEEDEYVLLKTAEGNLCSLIASMGELRKTNYIYKIVIASPKINTVLHIQKDSVKVEGNIGESSVSSMKQLLEEIMTRCCNGTIKIFMKLDFR
ncbi:hypothetical protein [Sulfuracidifex tepidarius]|uniref:Uncharacterized protein n=1 Tax=Sulfuracidifex tepidarius TaxID=1294262 RepID=A0A510E6P2_9CREN|nr:hypothetical protein [Sulfuracidifex tepidarius]BBG25303.1 hypothetical protein IC006_2638 [Sulfuracidifex tepidarius]BBG28097.1 hypothetical protein IC007_2652 [Sulfuracidifex tepidarius]